MKATTDADKQGQLVNAYARILLNLGASDSAGALSALSAFAHLPMKQQELVERLYDLQSATIDHAAFPVLIGVSEHLASLISPQDAKNLSMRLLSAAAIATDKGAYGDGVLLVKESLRILPEADRAQAEPLALRLVSALIDHRVKSFSGPSGTLDNLCDQNEHLPLCEALKKLSPYVSPSFVVDVASKLEKAATHLQPTTHPFRLKAPDFLKTAAELCPGQPERQKRMANRMLSMAHKWLDRPYAPLSIVHRVAMNASYLMRGNDRLKSLDLMFQVVDAYVERGDLSGTFRLLSDCKQLASSTVASTVMTLGSVSARRAERLQREVAQIEVYGKLASAFCSVLMCQEPRALKFEGSYTPAEKKVLLSEIWQDVNGGTSPYVAGGTLTHMAQRQRAKRAAL